MKTPKGNFEEKNKQNQKTRLGTAQTIGERINEAIYFLVFFGFLLWNFVLKKKITRFVLRFFMKHKTRLSSPVRGSTAVISRKKKSTPKQNKTIRQHCKKKQQKNQKKTLSPPTEDHVFAERSQKEEEDATKKEQKKRLFFF